MWERRKLTANRDGIRVELRGNASIKDQKAWAMMPKSAKQRLSKRLRNADGDSIPNGYDCHVRDRKRQEAFLKDDIKIVGKLKSVEAGKRLAHGYAGNVNEVEGLSGFIVKTKLPKSDKDYDPTRANAFDDERKFYKKYDLIDEPLFIPTKEVAVDGKKGLLRPKIKVLSEPNRIISRKITSKITDKQLEAMRKKIIHDSREGYVFNDGLQIGIDKAGRLLQYDTEIEKSTTKDAFDFNNYVWLDFLVRIHKARNEAEAAAKYGTISRRS